MKLATIYRITSETIPVTSNYMDIVMEGELPCEVYIGASGTVYTSEKYKYERIPVYELVDYGKQEYLAIDPKLKSKLDLVLYAEYTKKIDELEKELKRLENVNKANAKYYRSTIDNLELDLKFYSKEYSKIESERSVFLSLPWYKRIYRALIKKL